MDSYTIFVIVYFLLYLIVVVVNLVHSDLTGGVDHFRDVVILPIIIAILFIVIFCFIDKKFNPEYTNKTASYCSSVTT